MVLPHNGECFTSWFSQMGAIGIHAMGFMGVQISFPYFHFIYITICQAKHYGTNVPTRMCLKSFYLVLKLESESCVLSGTYLDTPTT